MRVRGKSAERNFFLNFPNQIVSSPISLTFFPSPFPTTSRGNRSTISCCAFLPSILDCHKHLGIKEKQTLFALCVHTRIALLALWRQVNNYVQIEIEEEEKKRVN